MHGRRSCSIRQTRLTFHPRGDSPQRRVVLPLFRQGVDDFGKVRQEMESDKDLDYSSSFLMLDSPDTGETCIAGPFITSCTLIFPPSLGPESSISSGLSSFIFYSRLKDHTRLVLVKSPHKCSPAIDDVHSVLSRSHDKH